MTIPDIRLANKSQVAEFFDVSLPTVESWIRKGAPVHERGSRGVSWKLDLRAIAQWLYDAQQTGSQADPDSMTPQDRKAWYESEEKKRRMEVRDRELIPCGEVEFVVSTAFAAVTQDLLSIPDKLERLHGVSPEIAAKVETEVCATLDSLRAKVSALAPAVGAQ